MAVVPAGSPSTGPAPGSYSRTCPRGGSPSSTGTKGWEYFLYRYYGVGVLPLQVLKGGSPSSTGTTGWEYFLYRY